MYFENNRFYTQSGFSIKSDILKDKMREQQVLKQDEIEDFKEIINLIEKLIKEKLRKLNKELSSKEKKNIKLDNIMDKILGKEDELKKILALKRWITRIHPLISNYILESQNDILLDLLNDDYIEMTVMSINLRKSTELMLNSKTPNDFVIFISELTEGLKAIVFGNYGIFDKFTGDGILAYFPDIFSGKDSVLNCCIASQECHNFFNDFYSENYDKFVVKIDTGLGIGIDYGKAKIVFINGEQTILGSPVAYACRLSSTPSNNTYLNVNVYSKIINYDINTQKIKIDLKNEDTINAYILEKIIDKNISVPDWIEKDIFEKNQSSVSENDEIPF